MFVPEKGCDSRYIHGTLCLCQRRGVTLAISMDCVFVSEKVCGCCYIP